METRKLKKTGFRITFEDGETLTRYLQPIIDKKCIIRFEADSHDRKNGLFGFDEIPYNNKDPKKTIKKLSKICLSDINKLKDEYTPITVDKKEYFVPWVSIRKGQTITLDLDTTIKEEDEYESIAFEEHPDFTITPTDKKSNEVDLKEAKKVKITCKNTNQNTAQIKVLADGKEAGAINFWYPKPKKVTLKWAIAEFNKKEFDDINDDFISSKLQEYFKKAFNPALIDIVIENEDPYEINIPILETATSTDENKDKIIKMHITKMRKNMDGTTRIISTKSDEARFTTNLYHIGKYNNNLINNETIILILTNLKCSRINKDGLTEHTNGFSLTAQGISIMALGNKEISPSVEIPHEIMHAICLEHTFNIDSGFEILRGKTDNYMDYDNTKKHTYKWQWAKLHKSKYSNEI